MVAQILEIADTLNLYKVWVDIACLPQGDHLLPLRLNLLSSMKHVYSSAAACLVLRPIHSQLINTLAPIFPIHGNISYAVQGAQLNTWYGIMALLSLSKDIWWKRVWTLQEWILPPQLIWATKGTMLRLADHAARNGILDVGCILLRMLLNGEFKEKFGTKLAFGMYHTDFAVAWNQYRGRELVQGGMHLALGDAVQLSSDRECSIGWDKWVGVLGVCGAEWSEHAAAEALIGLYTSIHKHPYIKNHESKRTATLLSLPSSVLHGSNCHPGDSISWAPGQLRTVFDGPETPGSWHWDGTLLNVRDGQGLVFEEDIARPCRVLTFKKITFLSRQNWTATAEDWINAAGTALNVAYGEAISTEIAGPLLKQQFIWLGRWPMGKRILLITWIHRGCVVVGTVLSGSDDVDADSVLFILDSTTSVTRHNVRALAYISVGSAEGRCFRKCGSVSGTLVGDAIESASGEQSANVTII